MSLKNLAVPLDRMIRGNLSLLLFILVKMEARESKRAPRI